MKKILKEKIKELEARKDGLDRNNPSVTTLYYETHGQIDALRAVLYYHYGNKINFDIL